MSLGARSVILSFLFRSFVFWNIWYQAPILEMLLMKPWFYGGGVGLLPVLLIVYIPLLSYAFEHQSLTKIADEYNLLLYIITIKGIQAFWSRHIFELGVDLLFYLFKQTYSNAEIVCIFCFYYVKDNVIFLLSFLNCNDV